MEVPATSEVTGHIDSGRAALARNEWLAALSSFQAATAIEDDPEAWEGLSWAAWWLHDARAVFEARERAYTLFRGLGDRRGAARMATWLATDHVDLRGEPAVARGWFRRAHRQLEGLEPGTEHGWLDVHEAEKLLLVHDTEGARRLARRATDLGRQLSVTDLEAMGLATEGLALVTEGQVSEGMGCLDEAAAAALGDELSEVWASGWCLCYVIYACERVRDYDRAAQWCERIEEWSEQRRLSLLGPTCRAHYAGVLIWRGIWQRAEKELVESAARLAEIRPPMTVEATVRLAELRRRQGRLDEAADLFEQAVAHPLALLGLSEVCLDRDEPLAARDRAQQHLRELPPRAGTLRAPGLELLIRAQAVLGDYDSGAVALSELEAVTAAVATDPLRASADFAGGILASATGEFDRARTLFEDATRLFHRCGAPFEAGRTRVALARVLVALGRRTDALREAGAAATSLRRVGAIREAEQADLVVTELHELTERHTARLTPRECEILSLVAEGRTNREIAALLVLSEHTVNRHMMNVLAKLGSASRSAAVAEALRRNLI